MNPNNTEFNLTEFDFAYPPGIEHHYWTISRNFLLAEALDQAGLSDEVMLEIGCGKGLVVAGLRARNMKCWGAELANVTPIQEASEFVKSNIDATTLESSFRNQVKVLLFLDVIEHIEDPVKFLENTLAYFPQASHLLITVPARNEIWSNYDEFYRHYRRYDLNMVKQTALSIHFNLSFISYAFHLLYWAARLKFVFSKNRAVKIKSPHGIGKVIHRFIGWTLVVESRLLPKSWAGTSIFCIASKQS